MHKDVAIYKPPLKTCLFFVFSPSPNHSLHSFYSRYVQHLHTSSRHHSLVFFQYVAVAIIIVTDMFIVVVGVDAVLFPSSLSPFSSHCNKKQQYSRSSSSRSGIFSILPWSNSWAIRRQPCDPQDFPSS